MRTVASALPLTSTRELGAKARHVGGKSWAFGTCKRGCKVAARSTVSCRSDAPTASKRPWGLGK